MTVAVRAACADALPALQLVQSSRNAPPLGQARCWLLLVLGICAMAFLPWQQSARGTGKVVAFVPQERQQTVTSPVKGIVVRVGEGLGRGARVKRGQFILEIQPQAANLVEQLQSQLQDLNSQAGHGRGQGGGVRAEHRGLRRRPRLPPSRRAEEMIDGGRSRSWDAKKQLVPAYEAKDAAGAAELRTAEGAVREGHQAGEGIEKLKRTGTWPRPNWRPPQRK